MPAPLNGHAFAPVLLEHLQAAAASGLPLGALVLWGMIRYDMLDAETPIEVSEKKLADRFGGRGEVRKGRGRRMARWLKDLAAQGWIVSEPRPGFCNLYRALLPGQRPAADLTSAGKPPDMGIQGPPTGVSGPPDTGVQGPLTGVSGPPDTGVQGPLTGLSGPPDTGVQGPLTGLSGQQHRTARSERAVEKRRTRRGKSAAPPDPRVKSFVDWFCNAYQTAVGTTYLVSGGKDGALVKGLLRKLDVDGRDPLVELQAAAEAMFADGWGREHASIGVLASQINTWRKKNAQPKGGKYAGGF